MADRQRIPSLDGLRAVSIALVLIGHVRLTVSTGQDSFWWSALGNGDLGVSVFFVISGFLITTLLMREQERTGRISLRNFYARRFFRIVPPLYAFLVGIVVLWRMGWLVVSWHAVVSAATFTSDYRQVNAWWLTHTWSLSVEEQFYLLWPLALSLLGTRKALYASVAIICLAPAGRFLTYALLPGHRDGLIYMFHSRIDGLMFGCALALVWPHPTFARLNRTVLRPSLAAALTAFLLVVSPLLRERWRGAYLLSAGYSLEGAAITLLLAYVVLKPKSAAGKVLNTAVLVHVGAISYGLYLWQQLFLSSDSPFLAGAFPMNVLLSFAAAELSFHTVERVAALGRARWRVQSRSHSGASL